MGSGETRRRSLGGEGRERPKREGPKVVAVPMGMALTLVLVFVFFALIEQRFRLVPAALEMDVLLTATTATAALMLGLVFGVQARHEVRRANLALATAAALLALLAIGVGELGKLLATSPADAVFDGVRTWSLVAVFTLVAINLPGRSSFLGYPTALLIGGLLAAAAMLVVALPPVRLHAPGILELAWGALALAHAIAFLGSRQQRYAWVGIALLGFTLGEVGRGLMGPESVWILGVPALRTLGILFAVSGLFDEVQRSLRRRSQELERSRERVLGLREITEATQRVIEERDHEARSALAAIEATAYRLRRRAARLGAAELSHLELAMTSEIAVLRRLITLPEPSSARRNFAVAAALRGVITAEQARGTEVTVDIAPDLVAVGMPEATAEIVQNLLDNARRHAAGSPVAIHAEKRDVWVLLCVDDAGPGIAPESRKEVFGRGHDAGHASSAAGRGLGLYIADRLAREQRGQLWVEAAPGGGASFRLGIPAAASNEQLASGDDPHADDSRALADSTDTTYGWAVSKGAGAHVAPRTEERHG